MQEYLSLTVRREGVQQNTMLSLANGRTDVITARETQITTTLVYCIHDPYAADSAEELFDVRSRRPHLRSGVCVRARADGSRNIGVTV